MIHSKITGIFEIKTDNYALTIDKDYIHVIVAGEEVASLRPLSAVNTVGEGDAINIDSENENESTSLAETVNADGSYTYIWTSSSSLWEKKEYILVCYDTHFEYKVRLTGKGSVDSVNYFSGNLTAPKAGSEYEFDRGYTPIMTVDGTDQDYFSAQKERKTFSYLMVPPMFVYTFKTPGIEPELAFGLVAERTEHQYTQFNYITKSDFYCRRFWFCTDQAGHSVVDGAWETPMIICYTAENYKESMKRYSDFYFMTGRAVHKDPFERKPRWWYGPMACGWVEQCAQVIKYGEQGAFQDSFANEITYRRFISELDRRDLHPQILIIDDKWQKTYGDSYADTDKWADLREFIDEQFEERNIHTMLWFKLWDAEGLSDDMCVFDNEGNRSVDPTNPSYRTKLKELLYQLLSSDEGCYNAFGLKLDFGFTQPVGRNIKSYDGKYGVELYLELIGYIHDCTKKIKPEAVVNCSPCHPLFAQYIDQARLHDYYPDLRRCFEEFRERRDIYEIAMPGVLFDTDGASHSGHRDTLRYLRLAHTLGIPDLYCITSMPSCEISDEEWAEVSRVWKEYGCRIDNMFI